MILFRRHKIILSEDIQEYYQKAIFIIFPPSKFMARLKLDLHNVYNNSKAIDQALNGIFEEAIEKRIREVEIIPGKGSGQLRKKVERFLQQPHIKPLYHRIENDSKNFGRLFVYFKF
jgi:dsDNA-specific endonuclease/ATPase MutS2